MRRVKVMAFLSKTYLSALFVLIVTAGAAQTSHFGNWLIYFGNAKLKKNYNWHHEIQHRNYNAFGDLEQLLLRTGIGKNFGVNQGNLLGGYAYVRSENYLNDTLPKSIVEEHRIFQQLILKQSLGRVAIQHRYRVEERFIKDDFLMRFRYFLLIRVPLNRSEFAPKTWYLSAYNEIFIVPDQLPFERNRLFGSIGYKFNENWSVEGGYMNQFLRVGERDQLNLIATFQW